MAQDIRIRSDAIRKLIYEWINVAGWENEGFKPFLELLGMQVPVSLAARTSDNSFKCTDANKKICRIRLVSENNYETCPVLYISVDEETVMYICNSKEKNNAKPKMEYCGRILKGDKNSVISDSSIKGKYTIQCIIEGHTLKFDMSNKEVITGFKKRKAENYLFGLNSKFNFQEVYVKLTSILGVNLKEANIRFSYIKNINESRTLLGRIEVIKSKITEYALQKEDEMIYLKSDNSWQYIQSNTVLNCISGQYSVLLNGDKKDIVDIDVGNLIQKANESLNLIKKRIG